MKYITQNRQNVLRY